MQTISRKDAQLIYQKVCSEWQMEIERILSSQKFSDTIEVDDDVIRRGFSEADADQRKLLKRFFTLPSDRIQSLDDVFKINGTLYKEVILFDNPKNKRQKSSNAGELLKEIVSAYNGKDHKFNWNDTSEPKYLPYFNKDSRGRWVLFAANVYHYSARAGDGFYFKNREDALDAVEKFMDVYIDWLPE